MDKRATTLPNLRQAHSEKKIIQIDSPYVGKFMRKTNPIPVTSNHFYSRPKTNKPTISSSLKAIDGESKSRNIVLIKNTQNLNIESDLVEGRLHTERCVTECDINNIIKACTKNKIIIEKKIVKEKKNINFEKDPYYDKKELRKLKEKLSVGLLLTCPPKSNTQKINFMTTNREHFMVKYDHLGKITPDLSLRNKDFLLKKYGIKKVSNIDNSENYKYFAKVYRFKMNEK